MSSPEAPPRSLEIVYEPGPGPDAWTGSCAAFPGLTVQGSSIHRVDLALAPLLTRALAALYGQDLAIHAVPGGDEALADGRRRKLVPVAPAYMSCATPGSGPALLPR